jgi:hypothetical protein
VRQKILNFSLRKKQKNRFSYSALKIRQAVNRGREKNGPLVFFIGRYGDRRCSYENSSMIHFLYA